MQEEQDEDVVDIIDDELEDDFVDEDDPHQEGDGDDVDEPDHHRYTEEELRDLRVSELKVLAEDHDIKIPAAVKQKSRIINLILTGLYGVQDLSQQQQQIEEEKNYKPPSAESRVPSRPKDDLDFIDNPVAMAAIAEMEGLILDPTANSIDSMRNQIRAERAERLVGQPKQVAGETIPTMQVGENLGDEAPEKPKGMMGAGHLMQIKCGPSIVRLGGKTNPTDRDVEYFTINGLNHLIRRGVLTRIPGYMEEFLQEHCKSVRYAKDKNDTLIENDFEEEDRYNISFYSDAAQLTPKQRRTVVDVVRTTDDPLKYRGRKASPSR